MALYAFDGTWNTAKTGDDPHYQNTNVVRFHSAYRMRSNTNDLYVAGIGTRFDLAGRILGGAFGLGELPRLIEAYDHLCAAWAAGDHVIDIVGFSRGAATTLDFCHLIQTKGIRAPGREEVVEASPQIRFLGVWDVVAAFGLAILGNTELNLGHHLSLPPSNLRYCFHALALDERRLSFLPTRLHGANEVWFRGVHSDVGGGNGNRGLNDISLRWMMSKAKAAGLPIADEDIAALRPDPATRPRLDPNLPHSIRLVSAVDRRHHTVATIQGCVDPPQTCSVEFADDEQVAGELGAAGIEVLPPADRVRINVMWETALDAAGQLDFTIDQVKEPLVTLFQGRVSLVTNDEQLRQAREAVVRLIATMVEGARLHGFRQANEFALTEALFRLPRLFPLTD
jgi:hypothetical protein